MATTRDILAMLDELVKLSTLQEESPQSFKVRAYENAKLGLEADGRNLPELTMAELVKIKGVGKATASKIREYVDTGSVEKLEKLRAEYPPEFVELSKIPGLGPKTLKLVRSELGVENVAALRQAVADQKLRTLAGLGAASEEKIGKAIERLGLHGKDRRTPIADAMPLAVRLVEELALLDGVVDAAYCGSLRRMSETIGDIDITVASTEPAPVMTHIRTHHLAADVVAAGETKTSIVTREGLQVDVRVVAPDQFGAATLYFTGSKAHNIALRQRAINKDMLLNEYGLFTSDKELVASKTEEEIYEKLGMPYIVPPMRESTGEIEAAADGTMPNLITLSDMKGDLHYHTDRSGDGRSSLADMVASAAAKGYSYLAITDHGEDLAINGSNREEMLEHRENIRTLQGEYPDMTLLYGCELNIGKSGGLDYDLEFRQLFDYTVASVHSHYDQDPLVQTDRLIAAISDPSVNSIGHLSGRYIGRRPGIEFDVDAVLDALASFDVALEVNGALPRLDAGADVVRKAVAKNVRLVINTDSHHVSELGRMEYGINTAQRGWAPRDLVVNALAPEDFFAWLASRNG